MAIAIGLMSAACAGSAPTETVVTEPMATEPVAEVIGQRAPQAPEGSRLRTIQDRGKLVCGTRYSIATFAYLNPETRRVEGFDADMCRAIAKYILGDPEAVEFKEVLGTERFSFLTDGVIDVLASTTTINAERLKEVDFSDVYLVAGQTLLVPIASTIAGVDDLAGKKVGVAKGSTSETTINALSDEKSLGAEVVLFETSRDAAAEMDAGSLDAVTSDDVILEALAREAPDKWKVVGEQFTKEPYGIGIKKGEIELVEAVNAVVHDLKASGAWQALYKTWLPGATAPEPPPDDWQAVVAP
jgi:putative glutamine transport system substrate-binding protein